MPYTGLYQLTAEGGISRPHAVRTGFTNGLDRDASRPSEDRRHRPGEPGPPAQDGEDLRGGHHGDRPAKGRDVAVIDASEERGHALQGDRQERREADSGERLGRR